MIAEVLARERPAYAPVDVREAGRSCTAPERLYDRPSRQGCAHAWRPPSCRRGSALVLHFGMKFDRGRPFPLLRRARSLASRLHGPAPAVEKYNHTKIERVGVTARPAVDELPVASVLHEIIGGNSAKKLRASSQIPRARRHHRHGRSCRARASRRVLRRDPRCFGELEIHDDLATCSLVSTLAEEHGSMIPSVIADYQQITTDPCTKHFRPN